MSGKKLFVQTKKNKKNQTNKQRNIKSPTNILNKFGFYKLVQWCQKRRLKYAKVYR